MITTLKELNIADGIILSKVCEKLNLTEDTAKTYLQADRQSIFPCSGLMQMINDEVGHENE